ncbi:MAG: phosphoribosylformylglycinamidine cyclo-ligase, partial [Chloroflexi bacterium]
MLLRRRHGSPQRAHRRAARCGRHPPTHRRGHARLSLAGGHGERDRRYARGALHRVLHRRLPRAGAARAPEERAGGEARAGDRVGVTELTYRATGVDPTRAEKSLAQVRERIARTRTPEVIGDIGAFGGLFASPGTDRVLVATTDGVGTKLEIARLLDRHEVIGTDLVHHCVNDAMAMGAEPLFFLDYFSTSRIDPAVFARVVGAMADACAAHGCALIGGETAEMPGMYLPGAYDVAGFLVGVVAREAILRPDSVREGDVCIGLMSSGLHTNGYTLARAIAAKIAGAQGRDVKEALTTPHPELGGRTLGDALLAPHTSYLSHFRALRSSTHVRSIAHLTGGGWEGNLPRALPAGLGAVIDR